MDQFLGKLTNLSYEFFGILFPGFVLLLFLVWWWWCVGELGSILSVGYLSALGMKGVSEGYVLVPNEIRMGIVIYVFFASYFLGHLINWVGRSGGARESEAESKWSRTKHDMTHCLFLRVPKPKESFDPGLQSLLASAIEALKLPSDSINWSTFYPVAKSWIAQELSHSLIVTYQNKY